ncbi:uncharacterized protein LOC142530064 [Primulina tabacum]|uniref:uncharacterized protein LOC142530064 n=1 Tax=Primulina tabacum TaxID=48773 RepID=UPI003F59B6BE
MAGKGFDPHDIRSDMGHADDVALNKTTSAATPTVEPPLPLVSAVEELVPLEIIEPGDPGNPHDLDNPPIIPVFNPPCQQVRRSKRQAGYYPDLTPGKRFRYKGQPSTRPSLIDPAETLGDDSDDANYEFVARKKSNPPPKEGKSTSSNATGSSEKTTSVPPQEPSPSTEEEITLVQFMATLKNQKSEASDAPVASPETEKSTGSSSSADTPVAVNEAPETNEAVDEDAVNDVADTSDNTDFSEYDLDGCYNSKFYTENSFSNWDLYTNREFIEERNADMAAFSRNNLIEFLNTRGLLSTLSYVLPFCHKAVAEFYGNLSSGVSDPRSAKFGKVFVRNKIYNFDPQIINDYYITPSVPEGPPPDLDEVVSVLTGGLIGKFPAHLHKVSATKLTTLYSVLHKVATRNWTLSTNTTVVTKSQALTLFAISNDTLNFGRMVFSTVMQYADGGLKSSKLPFPSLIYGILVSQGFVRNVDEGLSDSRETIKIAKALFKGNRKVDLPWKDSSKAPSATGPTTASTSRPPKPGYVKITVAGAQTHLDHALKKIAQAKAELAYYESLAAAISVMLEMAVHGQKGGDDQTGAAPSGTKDDEEEEDSGDEETEDEEDEDDDV